MCSFPDLRGYLPLFDPNLEDAEPLRYLRISRNAPLVFTRDKPVSMFELKKYTGKLLSLVRWHSSSGVSRLVYMLGRRIRSAFGYFD
jgi:hypothetical protein